MWRQQTPDALLFDCDGTLADTMPVHFVAWQDLAEAHGLPFAEDRFYALAGRPTRDIIAALAGEAGLAIDVEEATWRKEANFLARLDGVLAIEPVVEVVRRSHGRRPMAVVTGGHREVCARILAHVGIADCFETLVASEDTDRHKPDPDPFLEAARRLGVRPERCVVWEDSDLGLEAARRAGMQWIDVRPLHPPRRLTAP